MAQTEQNMPAIFSAKTLADRWACSETTIRTMIKKGDLKTFKIGGALLRIKLSEVLRWENESAGKNMKSENSDLADTAVLQSLTGTMKAATSTKSNSAKQSKALQELRSINSQQKPN